MCHSEPSVLTQHAMLVAWGQFAQRLGLIHRLGEIDLHQKTVAHRPQAKILEFLVAILAGLPHLKDISQSAHPLDQDVAVANAWQQPTWADYSGVSRSLSELTLEEARQIAEVLHQISQPIIYREVMLAVSRQDELVYDGDLTGRPVSNTSTTYPDVAYGLMSDHIQLGYQAAVVSMHSPTHGRLWLSAVQHPGDTVSCTQAEAIVRAAEARTGMRPMRRTDLLRQRVQDLALQQQALTERVQHIQHTLHEAQARLDETQAQVGCWHPTVTELESAYAEHPRGDRPHSRLAQARAKRDVFQRRQTRQEKALGDTRRRLDRWQVRLEDCQAKHDRLQERLAQCEHENAANPFPIHAVFRLDAGFGTRDNLALLIELGYEAYLKPQGAWLLGRLKRRVDPEMTWTRVGDNAEMVAWADMNLADFPYPLDVGLERFQMGATQRYSVLLHFGRHPVISDLPGWFARYNGRQIVEAGIKEGKQVFQMHHLKVRSTAGLFLQEQFAAFGANFVRWAAEWLVHQYPQMPPDCQVMTLGGVKEQVQVAAHTSAVVHWHEQGCLLRFTEHSVFAGSFLRVEGVWAIQLALPFARNCIFSPI
jgi:hypothetical protein